MQSLEGGNKGSLGLSLNHSHTDPSTNFLWIELSLDLDKADHGQDDFLEGSWGCWKDCVDSGLYPRNEGAPSGYLWFKSICGASPYWRSTE